MKMRNLNPYTGLRQVVTGYLCLPRKPILEWICKKKIDAGRLGSFIIFLISADWDKDPHRKGFIRLSDSYLSNIWGIPASTLSRWGKQLISAGLIEKVNGCYRIIAVDLFTFDGAKKFSRKVTNEEIKRLFPDVIKNQPYLETEYSKTEESEPENTGLFSGSFKKSFEGGFTKNEVTRNDSDLFDSGIARRKDKSERQTSSGRLTHEDIDWINKYVKDSSRSTTRDDQFERDIKDTLF